MFKRVWCLYIVDIQTCICAQGYTRLRGMLGVETPTLCDACFLGFHVLLSADLLKEKGRNMLDVLIDKLNVVDTQVVRAPWEQRSRDREIDGIS